MVEEEEHEDEKNEGRCRCRLSLNLTQKPPLTSDRAGVQGHLAFKSKIPEKG